MRFVLLTLLIAGWSSLSDGQSWGLVWSDEFNGTSIDTTNWMCDVSRGGGGGDELEDYTNRPENVRVENGNLLIIARKESYEGRDYTSARLRTQGRRSFAYGRIEARIKLPRQTGLWPAFWLLGNSIEQQGWPRCGEVDIMEYINTRPTIYGTMHWDNNGHVKLGSKIACNVTSYHTYAVEWDSNAIRWYLDTTKYCDGNIADGINGTSVFHEPFFLLLNLAVGGDWPGSPDAGTMFPDTMFVDYVRVYRLASSTRPR